MIDQHNFAIEPWAIREEGLQLDRLGHTESVFALANGHLGLRGNLDEGDPHGSPGTYLNSFFDTRPLPYAEAGYGYPESGQTIINVTNGKLIRLLVDDEPFDIRYGELHQHQRRLDFRAGTLSTVICRLGSGQRLRVIKYLAYGWSSRRSIPALYDQVRAAISAARYTGWDGLCTEQRRFLDDYWTAADLEVDGDPQLQQAVRFALFHVMQAGVRAERRAIAAKALTGAGYDGHTFWDTETFVLPMLSHTLPDAAADALRWRQETLRASRRPGPSPGWIRSSR